MENNTREENGMWRRVADWLMLEFLRIGRSSLNALDGGVVDQSWSSHRKSLPKLPIGREGVLKEAEGSGASRDEVGVIEGRHNH